MKKLLSVILALTLIVSSAALAFAAPAADQTGTITVNNTTSTTKLEFYKILEYTLNEVKDPYTEPNYSDVDVVEGAYKFDFVKAINDYQKIVDASVVTGITDDSSVSDIMLYITKHFSDSSSFAAILAGHLSDRVTGKTGLIVPADFDNDDCTVNANSIVLEDVDVGYYLILDVTKNFGDPDDPTNVDYPNYYKSVVMLQPANKDITINLKSDSYTEQKKVIKDGETNGSVNIGDVLTFEITSTVPALPGENDIFIVYDKMFEGLEFVGLGSVKIGDADVTHTFDSTGGTDAKGNAYDMSFTFEQPNVKPGDVITILYTAKVTKTAQNGNIINTVWDNYWDDAKKVETYTFTVEVNKTDEYENALEGVAFKIFKKVKGDNDVDVDTYLNFDADGTYNGLAASKAVATRLTTDEYGKINVHGLAAGVYYLDEIETIDGYNLLDEPFEVVIKVERDGEGKVISLCQANVVNYTGIILPGTGGIGTTLFTIVGLATMAGASSILFFNKKRLFNR